MSGAASVIDGGAAAGDACCGAGRAAVPAPPLGRLALGVGLLLVLFVEPFAAAVLQPHADLGLDRVVAGKPQRLDLLQSVRLACRDDQHFARWFRLVRPLQRELKPDMLNAGLSRPAHLLAAF
jgi:hypothetical protein